MVTRTVKEVHCDVCERDGAEHYLVAKGPQGRTRGVLVDLCDEHAAPLETLLGLGAKVTIEVDDGTVRPKRRKSPVPTARRNETPVYSMDELKKLEQK